MAPTLVYFDLHALGSALRLALDVAGIEFTDERVNGSNWASVKNSTPLGQLPFLRLDSGYELPQSLAILEYIADVAGWTPSCPVEAAQVRALLHCVGDLNKPVVKYFYAADDDARAAMKETVTADFIALLKKLDALIGRTEKDGYFLGSSRKTDTVADLFIADYTAQAPHRPAPFDRVAMVKQHAPAMFRICQRFIAAHEKQWKAQKPAYNLC